MSEEDRSVDVLGIKPLAKSAEIVTSKTMEGAGAFLGRICLPAAEEFGLLIRDKVSAWRARNATQLAEKAEKLHRARPNAEKLHAHPRVIGQILEQGSWEDSDHVQDMWAGLLASACTEAGDDQQNLIFINLLRQITSSEALLLNYACENVRKYRSKSGLIAAQDLTLQQSQIVEIMQHTDPHIADVELDHLRELGLLTLSAGFSSMRLDGNIEPSALGLNFYVRCQGYVGSPVDYFGLIEDPLETTPQGGESEERQMSALGK